MNTRSSFALLITLTTPILALAGCSSSGSGGDGGAASTTSAGSTSSAGDGGGASSSSSTSSSSSGTSSSSSGTSSSSSGTSSSSGGDVCSGPSNGLPPVACKPSLACENTEIAQCLPLHDNAGAASFGLRVASLALTAPLALTSGTVKIILNNTIEPNRPSCNLNGSGTFSWLLAFDTVAGTLKTGGAKPVADPALGYSFVTQDFVGSDGPIHVAPVTMTAPLGASCITTSSAADLTLPVYLDNAATNFFLLPLRQARFSSVTVSGNHDCIGKYNAAGLSPGDNCLGSAQTPAYFPGGQVDAFINLDDADKSQFDVLKQSLCVVLTGDSTQYGDGGSPKRCKRVNGKILFEGDWCTATNQAATAQCKDAVRFAGEFAASGVIIN